MKEVLTIEKTVVWLGEKFLSEAFHFSERSLLILDDGVSYPLPLHLCDHVIRVPGGEGVKSRTVLIRLQDELLANEFSKDTHIVVCGGGATLDLAGFLAATYAYGVRLTYIPSTLLGMCDGAIGGKNGLNIGRVKNAIGTIYHPKRVIIDVSLLETLPLHELNNGIIEMIKHATLDSLPSLLRLESHIQAMQQKEPVVLLEEIQKSMLVKKRYVEGVSLRELVHFGHTFGHAIEALEDFYISHGQAVALGCLAESYMALLLGELSSEDFETLKRVIYSVQMPLELTRKFSHAEWNEVFGSARFVLLQGIGKVYEKMVEISQDVVEEAIDWVQEEAVAKHAFVNS
jgi:3-dehydroquinate synthase